MIKLMKFNTNLMQLSINRYIFKFWQFSLCYTSIPTPYFPTPRPLPIQGPIQEHALHLIAMSFSVAFNLEQVPQPFVCLFWYGLS